MHSPEEDGQKDRIRNLELLLVAYVGAQMSQEAHQHGGKLGAYFGQTIKFATYDGKGKHILFLWKE